MDALDGQTDRSSIEPELAATFHGLNAASVSLRDLHLEPRMLLELLLHAGKDAPDVAHRDEQLGVWEELEQQARTADPTAALVHHDRTVGEGVKGVADTRPHEVLKQSLAVLRIRNGSKLLGLEERLGEIHDLMHPACCRSMDERILREQTLEQC